MARNGYRIFDSDTHVAPFTADVSLDRGFLNGEEASMNIRLVMRAYSGRALSHWLPARGLGAAKSRAD